MLRRIGCKITAAFLFVAFFTLLLSGCLPDSSDEKEIAMTISADPKNFDPLIAADEPSRLVISNLFEGLMTYSENGALVCGAAESYEVSEGDTRYVFTLRKNGKWADGTPVTAQNFVFTFQRMFTSATLSPYAGDYSCIKNAAAVLNGEAEVSQLGVQALGDYTLQIDLESANANFLSLLALPPAVPCSQDFFNSTEGRYGVNLSDILGNGPYMLKTWKAGSYLLLQQNLNYSSQTTPDIPKVILYVGNDDSSEYSNLKSKKTQVGYVSAGQVEDFSDKKYDKRDFWDTTWILGFKNTDSIFSDPSIRMAFSLAFNSQWVADSADENRKAASFLINDAVTYNRRVFREAAGNTYGTEYDLAAAKAYLSYGLKNLELSELPKLTVYCPDDKLLRAAMAKYQSNLQKNLAVYLNVQYVSQSELNDILKSGSFQLAVYPIKAGGDPLLSMLAPFGSGNSRNYLQYSRDDYDLLLSRSAQSSDADEILALCGQAEAMLMEDSPFVPLAFEKSYFVFSRSVGGLENAYGFPYVLFKNAYISED